MNDYKKRIQQATEKFLVKHDPTRTKRKNQSAERDLQKSVISWLNTNGFDVDNIESKAQFVEKAGTYISQAQTPGHPDIMGNDVHGRAVFIELKAPGRISSLRANQRKFLVRKIKTNCFAIAADSIECIESLYSGWQSAAD